MGLVNVCPNVACESRGCVCGAWWWRVFSPVRAGGRRGAGRTVWRGRADREDCVAGPARTAGPALPARTSLGGVAKSGGKSAEIYS